MIYAHPAITHNTIRIRGKMTNRPTRPTQPLPVYSNIDPVKDTQALNVGRCLSAMDNALSNLMDCERRLMDVCVRVSGESHPYEPPSKGPSPEPTHLLSRLSLQLQRFENVLADINSDLNLIQHQLSE